jgi:hypothetical protein
MDLVRRSVSRVSHAANLARAAVTGASLLIVALALNAALVQLRGVPPDLARVWIQREFVERYTGTPSEQIEHLVRFPEMVARSLIATRPLEMSNTLAAREGSPIQFELTYSGAPVGWMSIALWVLGLGTFSGIYAALRNGSRWSSIGLAAAAAMATFGIVYGLFGLNTFLYSQYWQVPAVFLIGAWLERRASGRAGLWVVCGILLPLMLVADWFVVRDITDRMAEARAAVFP